MELAKSGGGLVARLGEAEVRRAVVEQLRKDLAAGEELAEPPAGDTAFEALRAQVLPLLEEKQCRGVHDLQVALYRVDLGEQVAREAVRLGGLHELAGRVVLRALQKVLTRLTLR
jgi:hypothetical protein